MVLYLQLIGTEAENVRSTQTPNLKHIYKACKFHRDQAFYIQ